MTSEMAAPGTPPRVLRRRAAQKDTILALAAERFASSGIDGVRLEAIAEAADVSRGTVYSHFATKEALITAIVLPALLATRKVLRCIAADTRDKMSGELVEALLRQWAVLWREHRAAMKVGHGLHSALPPELMPAHRAVVRGVHQLFTRVARTGRLRGTPEWASMLVARLGVPLLETYETIDPSGEVFVEAVTSMLLRPDP
jgi:AcrR family transcriptional regulator